jgi:uncharacterized coiled-coil DUF342 family protein
VTTSAPRARLVDALSGTKAPSKFFQALSEADKHVALAAELEAVRDERDEALVRADELWQTVCDQSVELNALRAQLDRARAERDTYRLAVSK